MTDTQMKEALNTDRELWRTSEGDYYSKHKLYVTEKGWLTLCEIGHCVSMPPEQWFALTHRQSESEEGLRAALRDAHTELLEAQDKFHVFWCNVSKGHPDSPYMLKLRDRMGAAADRVQDALRNAGHAKGGFNAMEREKEILDLRHDIHAYRGALGYSVPGYHDGRLSDGTQPKCGMCDARAKGGEWLPISEAPKDSPVPTVDLWIPDESGGYRVPDCYWNIHDGWWSQIGSHGRRLNEVAKPTHYRLTPTPPVEADDE